MTRGEETVFLSINVVFELLRPQVGVAVAFNDDLDWVQMSVTRR